MQRTIHYVERNTYMYQRGALNFTVLLNIAITRLFNCQLFVVKGTWYEYMFNNADDPIKKEIWMDRMQPYMDSLHYPTVGLENFHIFYFASVYFYLIPMYLKLILTSFPRPTQKATFSVLLLMIPM